MPIILRFSVFIINKLLEWEYLTVKEHFPLLGLKQRNIAGIGVLAIEWCVMERSSLWRSNGAICILLAQLNSLRLGGGLRMLWKVRFEGWSVLATLRYLAFREDFHLWILTAIKYSETYISLTYYFLRLNIISSWSSPLCYWCCTHACLYLHSCVRSNILQTDSESEGL